MERKPQEEFQANSEWKEENAELRLLVHLPGLLGDHIRVSIDETKGDITIKGDRELANMRLPFITTLHIPLNLQDIDLLNINTAFASESDTLTVTIPRVLNPNTTPKTGPQDHPITPERKHQEEKNENDDKREEVVKDRSQEIEASKALSQKGQREEVNGNYNEEVEKEGDVEGIRKKSLDKNVSLVLKEEFTNGERSQEHKTDDSLRHDTRNIAGSGEETREKAEEEIEGNGKMGLETEKPSILNGEFVKMKGSEEPKMNDFMPESSIIVRCREGIKEKEGGKMEKDEKKESEDDDDEEKKDDEQIGKEEKQDDDHKVKEGERKLMVKICVAAFVIVMLGSHLFKQFRPS